MSAALSLIVAVSENGVIGRDGDMPWRLSTDLKRFKSITLGKPIIMGRKTWHSLPSALPGRLNIVVTRDKNFQPQGVVVTNSLESAIALAQAELTQKALSQTVPITNDTDDIFIIGGGEIFKAALPMVKKLYVTEILAHIEGDTFFPKIDENIWHALSSESVPAGEKDSHPTCFSVYERNNS